MSYAELRQHAQRIEELAFETSLKLLRVEQRQDGSYAAELDGAPISDGFVELIREQHSGIAAMFDPFLDLPDPAALGRMHEELLEAAQSLARFPYGSMDPIHGLNFPANGEMNKIGMVSDALFEWHGFGAEHFKAQFLEPFPDVATNQFSLVSTLMGAIKAEQVLWEECRKNLDELAHAAIESFESMGDHGAAAQVVLLSLVASIFSVGAAVTTGGTSLVFTGVGAVAQVAGTVKDKMEVEDAPTLQFDAKTPHELREQLMAGLYGVAYQVLRKEQQIADAMMAMSETVAAMRSSFVSPRPALADQSRKSILTSQGLGFNA